MVRPIVYTDPSRKQNFQIPPTYSVMSMGRQRHATGKNFSLLDKTKIEPRVLYVFLKTGRTLNQ